MEMRTKLRKQKDTWLGPHAQAQVEGKTRYGYNGLPTKKQRKTNVAR